MPQRSSSMSYPSLELSLIQYLAKLFVDSETILSQGTTQGDPLARWPHML